MYGEILKYFKDRPAVYSPGTSAFWDDVHITKYILDAHLAPEDESATRKHSFVQESVDWIAHMCNPQERSKLLDLGCGPGIYGEMFCKASFNVTGIDFSKRSIKYAIKNAIVNQMQINYLYQNYLDINYEDDFDIVTIIYCDFGVSPPAARQLLLKKIRKALKKDGILILDGYTKHHFDDFLEGKSVEYHGNGFWCENPYICIQCNYLYQDTQNYLEQYVVITQNDCQCYNVWNQVFSADSLACELKAAGFENVALFDNVCGKPLSNTSKTICAVAK